MSKRLQKEFADLQTDQRPEWCSVALEGDNLFKWIITIIGPDGTPYEKGKFQVVFDIPKEYPFKPPKLKFATKIYHPNIKSDGSVCLDIVNTEWTPQVKIHDVLLVLRQCLQEPNASNPVEPDIALQFEKDRAKFDKTAKEWTKKHAKVYALKTSLVVTR